MKNNKKYNLFNNFFKIIISKKWFTFIELIIAITILAILSVIWFISYNSHLSTSRDTVRKSDLSEIYSLLDYYKIKAPLIVPDKKIEIYSNWTLLWYQWYLSDNIISNIWFKWSGKDPIDDIFYTYYLTSDYRNTWVMAFLENNPNQLSYVNSAFLPKIYAIDYSDRYPIVFWKKIWILLDENKIPIQENASLQSTWKLEISTITSDYTAYIDNKTSISNSWYTMEVLYWTVLTWIVWNDCDQYIKESNWAPLISWMYLINSNTWIYEKYCDMWTTSWSWVNTRIANCSWSLPSNSYAINWNTYIQRYNWTTWIPELSWAENQLIWCDFDCNNNYSWSWSINSCLQISNWVCWSSNWIATLVAPISNLCSLWTSTSVISNIWDYTWSCNWINDWTNSICNAQRIYIVSWNFWANANWATINVCWTNVTADSSWNFTTTRNYWAVCNTITATRTNYTCITTQNWPASLESDTTNIEWSCTLNTYTVSW
jgi:type II secretory pathway pseudopilin PulG